MTYATISNMHIKSEKRKDLLIFLYFMGISSLLLIKYSTSSPAYLTNQWVDTNASLTVGKSILQGIVPYKDLFDQRGPLLYLISAICSLFELSNPFFGFYIYEALCGGIFLFYCRKLLQVFSQECSDVFLSTASLFYWLLLREPNFGLGGSPEELCVPALMITLYVLVRSIHLKKLLTFQEGIWIGLCAGYIFWIKYNMMGLFAGAAIAFLISYGMQSEWKQIGKILLGVLTGIGIISFPVFAYFGWNHALSDMFEVYFQDNILYYTTDHRILYKFYFSVIHLFSTIRDNLFLWLMIAAGGIYCFFKERQLFFFLLLSGGFHVFFVYQGGQPFPYYGYSFVIYGAMGYLWLKHLKNSVKLEKLLMSAGFAFSAIIALSALKKHFLFPQNETVQKHFAEEMNTDSTLLTYHSLDLGLYIAAAEKPSVYYSWVGNLMTKEISEIQDHYVENGATEYVVSEEEIPQTILSEKYRLIDQYNGFFLYQKTEDK